MEEMLERKCRGMQGTLLQCTALLLVGSRKMMRVRKTVFLEEYCAECRARIAERKVGHTGLVLSSERQLC